MENVSTVRISAFSVSFLALASSDQLDSMADLRTSLISLRTFLSWSVKDLLSMTGSWTLLRGGDPCPKKFRTVWKAMTSSCLERLGMVSVVMGLLLRFGRYHSAR